MSAHPSARSGAGQDVAQAGTAAPLRRDLTAERLRLVAFAVGALSLGGAIGTGSSLVTCLSLCAACLLAGAVSGGLRPWTCLVLAPLGVLAGVPWPLAALAAAVASVLVDGNGPALVSSLRRGSASSTGWVVLVVVGCFGAPAWFLTQARFSTDPVVLARPEPPLLVLIAAVSALALLNGVAEELLWRQSLMAVGRRSGSPPPLTVLVLAGSFGLAHLHGIPAGPGGAIAAGAFGLALSVVRLRWGLAAAIYVHVLVDLVILAVVAHHALFLG